MPAHWEGTGLQQPSEPQLEKEKLQPAKEKIGAWWKAGIR